MICNMFNCDIRSSVHISLKYKTSNHYQSSIVTSIQAKHHHLDVLATGFRHFQKSLQCQFDGGILRERNTRHSHFFLLLLRPFPICYHYQECPGIRQTKPKASTSLPRSIHLMAPWLHGSMPSSLGWEPQFPVSSSKSSLYLKSKMIEIQT